MPGQISKDERQRYNDIREAWRDADTLMSLQDYQFLFDLIDKYLAASPATKKKQLQTQED